MNNDLISRKRLKNRVALAYYHNNGLTLGEVKDIIDNAPTVEPCKDCEDKRQAEYIRHGSSWHELQSLRKFKEEHERPQGEWIWLGDNPSPNHKWSCNKCGRGVKEQENFCPHCGAKMRKGGAEK